MIYHEFTNWKKEGKKKFENLMEPCNIPAQTRIGHVQLRSMVINQYLFLRMETFTISRLNIWHSKGTVCPSFIH